MMRHVLLGLLLLCCLGMPEAQAHKGRPMFVQIEAMSAEDYRMSWRFPPNLEGKDLPELGIGPDCQSHARAGRDIKSSNQTVGTAFFKCKLPLAELSLSIHYPEFNPGIPTLLRVIFPDGNTYSRFASPETSVMALSAGEGADGSVSSGVTSYFSQGIIHIARGIDHLLFVACLVFVAGTLRRILVTITGFTIAHSFTLGLSALNLVQLPVPPVEASIALSILFLAHELARPQEETLTWRYPVLVSSLFGLLHGFGFATALVEIGLPQAEKLWALFLFNVGVEAGQIAFVLCLLPLVYLLHSRNIASNRQVQTVAAYLIGTVAMYWTIQRIFL